MTNAYSSSIKGFFSLWLLMLAVCAKAITPANTVIMAQAEATFYDTEYGKTERALSNQALFTVGPVAGPRLQQSQQLTATPGQQISFVHRLTNLGNADDHFQLKIKGVDGPALNNLAVYEYNGGLPAPGTPPLTETRTLPSGESIDLVVLATVPTTEVQGEVSTLELSALSELDDKAHADNQDQITIGSVAVRVQKTVDKTEAEPGENLTYAISLNNIGDSDLPARDLVIDGQAKQGVLLEDLIPPQTLLDAEIIPKVAPVQAIAVVRDLSGHWLSFEKWNKSDTVTRIGLFVEPEYLPVGQSALLEFAATINRRVLSSSSNQDDKSSVLITNEATISLDNTQAGNIRSNKVSTNVFFEGPHPSDDDILLRFIQPKTFDKTPAFDSDMELAGFYYLMSDNKETQRDVYLELKGKQFQQSAEQPDTVEVTVSSDFSDTVHVLLQETGLNTGVFRSQSPLHLSERDRGGNLLCQSDSGSPDYTKPGKNCRLNAADNSTLTASVTDPVTLKTFSTTAGVTPKGIAFDSTTLAPLGNVTINFTDIQGNPVEDSSGRPIPDQVTKPEGAFYYPPLKPGRYFINVKPATGYDFPSKIPPEELPGRFVTDASYGKGGGPTQQSKGGFNIAGSFSVDNRRQFNAFDVPLDSASVESLLTLEKEAKQKEVAPGELVAYELTVKNNSETDLYNLQVLDSLPFGFKYMAGSVRVNGEKVADPEGAPGPKLTFHVRTNPALAKKGEKKDELKITYALKAGAGSVDSDGINRATATAKRDITGQTVNSNEAKAQVMVKMEGVLSDKAILFGKVYVDSNCDDIQSPGEWPIGGVRLYMEDGTWVITDENGQYSLMGLKPGMHVIKVDPVTLPDGLVLKPLDNRHAADGNSRFADLAPGEMHRGDFAAMCPAKNQDAIFAQIKARNKSISGEWLLDDAAQYNRSKPTEQADSTGDISHGVIRGPRDDARKEEKQPEAPKATSKTEKTSQPEKVPAIPLPKQAIKTVTQQQAIDGTWLWPLSQQADGRFIAVVRAGITPVLTVNGEPVSHDRLGAQLVNNREQAQLLAWYGVPLKEGENRVEVKGKDFFGNERILAKGLFTHSGPAEKIEIKPAADTLEADDGRSTMPVTIRLLDKSGLPARGVYFVTLETTGGRWLEPDIQDQEPGHQVRIDHGELTVSLRSGTATGPLKLRASTGELKAEAEITQLTAPRPLVAVGLVDLGVGQGGVPGLDEITDDFRTYGRTAMFIKGEIAEGTQLTLSYDSDKDEDTEMFRDIDPEDYYPITGDASQKGYEAQSRSKLYAKVERGRSTTLWGDYQTDSGDSENNLAKIQRSLTGLNHIYDDGDTRIQGFAARPENNHREEIIKPNGTAMNYRLQGAPIERNTETVVLEAHDSDNPGLIIKSETLTRGADYTLDEFSGYLKFSKPIHSQDEKGNPQQIRVNYDVEGNGDAYTVAGIRAQQKLSDKVKVGVSYTRDEHKTEGSDISGAWIEITPSDKTTIAISSAHMKGKSTAENSSTESGVEETSGKAARVKVKHQWDSASETELTWARAEPGFKNSAGGISEGREETRLRHKQRLNNNLDLRAEAEISRSLDDSGSSQGDSAGVYLDKKVGDGWKLTAGSRYIRQRNENDNDSYMTGQVGAEKRFKLLDKDASIKGEYEQALTNPRWRTAIEGEWKVHDKVSIYSRFERDDNLSPVASDSDRNQFSLGLKSDWLPNTKTYSEYRMRGATDGKTMEWVNGADTSVELTKGLSLTPSVELIDTVSGDDSNDGLAVSVGIQDKRHKNQRATGRVEYRHGKSQDFYGLDAAVARRLSLDWSALIREEFRLELPKKDDDSETKKHAMTLGLARRPKLDNRQHGLYLYQWKEERGQNQGDNRTVHLISTHQNRQISRDLTISGRIGSKWVRTSLDDYLYNSQTWLTDARLTWDLNRRWDMDIRGGVLAVDGTDSMRWSAGVGLYYLVMRNLRVGAYYNFIGFKDKDLDSQRYNAQGLHFSLQFKFDETLLNWFDI